MFKDVGRKIQILAIVFFIIGVINSLGTGLLLIFGKASVGGMRLSGAFSVGLGIAVMIIGSLLSWVGQLFVYGFGLIVQSEEEEL